MLGSHEATTTVTIDNEKSPGSIVAPTASPTQRYEHDEKDEERRITGGHSDPTVTGVHIDTTMRPSSSESAGGGGGERPEGYANAPRAKVLRMRTDSFDMNSSTVRFSARNRVFCSKCVSLLLCERKTQSDKRSHNLARYEVHMYLRRRGRGREGKV